MKIRKMLIYCVKLDHALYSINYSMYGWCMAMVWTQSWPVHHSLNLLVHKKKIDVKGVDVIRPSAPWWK